MVAAGCVTIVRDSNVRLSRGTRLGPYEILAPLGAGGMGEVYRARDGRLEREVALKVLPESLAGDPRALARFEREAKAIAALTHPNILAVFDVSLQGETPFAVTELLEGETLEGRISGGPLPWRQALGIGIAVAEGLAAAHSKGIVHRDLKPSNIFLTEDDRVKVLDFGLARMSKADSISPETSADTLTKTEPGTVLGTVGYMSPEQVRGLSAEPTSDIFSFGCVLFETIAGQTPFPGRTVGEVMASILRDSAPSLSAEGRNVPAELDRLVAHCLENSPGRRFQTAQDLLYALRSLHSSPDTTPAIATPPRRSAVLPALVALLGILALAATGWYVANRGPGFGAKAIRSVAVLPLVNLSGDAEQEYFADGMTDELITALSKIHELRVISRTSMMRFKGTKEGIPSIAKTLGVDVVVEGSVRRNGQQIRIAAKLIRAESEQSLWSESYERDMKDVFALQSEVAGAIVRNIGAKLTTDEAARLAPRPPVPADAYEAYLKGLFYVSRGDPESLEKSREHFERAIRLAPEFAPPFVGLSFYHADTAAEGAVAPKVAFPKAEAAAMKALELDPNHPASHVQLGWIYGFYHWNLEAAEKEFRRASELSGGSAYGPIGDGWMSTTDPSGEWAKYRGEFERSIKAAKSLLANDPLSLFAHLRLGTDYAWARRYDEAIEVYRAAVDLHPDSSEAHELLADAYASKRSYREAAEEQKKALEKANLDDWAEELGRDFGALGWEKAQQNLNRKRLDEMTALAGEGRYVSPLSIAALHVLLGEKDEAFRWLDKAVEDRSPFLVALTADPQWDSIRSDPRNRDPQPCALEPHSRSSEREGPR